MTKKGFSEADILLPASGTDMAKWAVIACDQYTSEPEYWKQVEEIVSDQPSTLRIMLPECYLESEKKKELIESIDKTMEDYLEKGLFTEYKDSYILVERTTENGTRYGLVGKLDLEEYDFSPDSVSLIRATEGTILSRIPPRIEIRKDAVLELPHIVVLISDEERSVIEPLIGKKAELEKVYDTDLMLRGGHIKGYLVSSSADKEGIEEALDRLYEKADKANPLVFAMGDGNHSLATAKTLWEERKKGLSEEEKATDPARWALVEIENIYDEGLQFEPIHRVLFGLSQKTFESLLSSFADFEKEGVEDLSQLEEKVNEAPGRFGLYDGAFVLYKLSNTAKALPAWTIQAVIDKMLKEGLGAVDYIHGADTSVSLAGNGNLAIILPDISKETFFASILSDKAFPRKTFSIGHANEKRYYLEARRIR